MGGMDSGDWPIAFVAEERDALVALRAMHRLPGGGVAGITGAWTGPRQEAGCSKGHATPDPGCACGFGVCDDIGELDACEYLRDCDAPVLALVKVWGRMVLDMPHGGATFRAQRCEILALAAVEPVDPDVVPEVEAVDALAARLGVPVRPAEELEAEVATRDSLNARRRLLLGEPGRDEVPGLGG